MLAQFLQTTRWGRAKASLTLLNASALQIKDSIDALRTVVGHENVPFEFATSPAWGCRPRMRTSPPRRCRAKA